MRRLLLALLLLLPGSAWAQVTNPLSRVFIIGTGGNCATTACSNSTRQMCRNSVADPTPYVCDTSTHFYVAAVGSSSSVPLALNGNDVNVSETTAVVMPNTTGTINAVTHFDHVWAKSVAVYAGCDLYDFALYQDDGFNAGEELLLYIGQNVNLYDGKPPILRDTDGTGEIHAKFWNTGTAPCSFTLQVQGVGF